MFQFSTTDTHFLQNAFWNGSSWRYINNGHSVIYQQNNGAGIHAWYTAPNGTAGDAITFTQAMTLDASGQLLLGTTSGVSGAQLTIGNGSSTTSVNQYLNAGSGGNALIGRISGSNTWFVGDTVNALGSGTGMTTYVYNANPWIVYTNGAERARIDSSGNLLVGLTSGGGYRLDVSSNGATTARINRSTNTGGLIDFANGGGILGSISTNGFSIAYNTTSDYRLKENVAPMTGALDVVSALKPCTFTFKEGGQASQGFIAHELQAVVPDAVTGAKDAVDAEGNPVYQGIDTSFLVATLTAAIQELKAEVDSLKAQLENK
jgi:hypothetical protein